MTENVCKCCRIFKRLDDEQIVYGVVAVPGVPDDDGFSIDREELEKACHKFMEDSQRILREHEGEPVALVIESFISPVSFDGVCKGAWVLAAKITDPDVWEDVRNGVLTEFEISGRGEYYD